jgi:mono/diheme cytochrome c family protein
MCSKFCVRAVPECNGITKELLEHLYRDTHTEPVNLSRIRLACRTYASVDLRSITMPSVLESVRGWTLSVAGIALVVASGCAQQSAAPVATQQTATKLPVVDLDEKPAFPLPKHLESKDIAAGSIPHGELFEDGAKLFHTPLNGLDGIGMKRTVGGAPVNRFSTGPAGGGQPLQIGAQSCGACHNQPSGAGSGLAHTRVLFDGAANGKGPFSPRATTSLFGNGVLQLVAEEMTEQLLAARDAAAQEAKGKPGTPVTHELKANGVDFGTVTATANAGGTVSFDMSKVRGVSPDLVIRPLGWKGNITTVRNFSTAASMFGLGLQSEEFVWRLGDKGGSDPDGDGVSRELSVGDITAMAVYNAAQAVPTELGHLVDLGLVAAPGADAKARIEKGRQLFTQAGCATCHIPEMHLAKTVFEEPNVGGGGNYIDHFLASKDADYDPKRPARFDFLKDSMEPRLEASPNGGAIVRLYGDLKRHDMGRLLADPAPGAPLDSSLAPVQYGGNVALIPPSVFLTPELWGVGSTGPWLHDDRAGTIAEAIALHGEDAPPATGQPGRSEAQESRDNYKKLTPEDQGAVVTFLKSLVAFSKEPKR